ncbi:TonB-dependent receptor, partial [Klebsiella pneumoniae]
IEYYRVFKQDNISKFEQVTSGYNMLNMTLAYKNKLSHTEYDLFFKANNLLDQKVYAHETFLPYIPQIGRNFSLGLNLNF